ncbi:MAG: hypothetical protein EBT04_15940 [Betaproteobacteria bacterium]|nr:hypothetical protein [Betaproteobacteria bacterium]
MQLYIDYLHLVDQPLPIENHSMLQRVQLQKYLWNLPDPSKLYHHLSMQLYILVLLVDHNQGLPS